MIFDVKMDNLGCDARFVTRGRTADTPHATTYASVVLRESVRSALALAALNDFE
jgi:hypothetical protein